MTLAEALRNSLQRCGHRVVLQADEVTLNGWDLLRQSESLAFALQDVGLKPGQSIAYYADTHPALVIASLAALSYGLVLIPINNQYRLQELTSILCQTDVRLIITDEQRSSMVQEAGSVLVNEPLCWTTDFVLHQAQRKSGWPPAMEGNEQETALLLFTSGTTGQPKGVPLSHSNIVSNLTTLIELWEWTPDDILLHTLPLHHVHGLVIALLGSLMAGSRLVLRKRFHPEDVWRTLAKQPITMFMGVPTMYYRLLQVGPARQPAHMRLFISGSAPLSEQVFHDFGHRVGHQILERAGMTETLINFSNPSNGPRLAGSVGPPLPGVEVCLLNDNLQPVLPGQPGEIAVKGPNVFRGYWNNPNATSQSFYQGWFLTGDIGQCNAHNYFQIIGRKKDIIKYGGILIYPAEIEQVILSIPGVADCTVVGVPDPEYGERIKACIVCSRPLTREQVVTYCQQQLASYKKPFYVEFFDELPRSSMGKILKDQLRYAVPPT